MDLLVGQVRSASDEVISSATDLNTAAEELAATTTEQSAAVTEASATAEELARASASIADTVDQISSQASETRDNLEQAEGDIGASSERTLALAERVSEIGAILVLINEIAEQTNLLALNAAIEAARADAGRAGPPFGGRRRHLGGVAHHPAAALGHLAGRRDHGAAQRRQPPGVGHGVADR
jgi:methyl-accepting chemotaxis protein